jgi:oligosaccharide 4-alpha-D-glucosyltransferase
MPLFVKAGSFLPMVEAVNNLELYSDEKLTVRYYVGSGDHRDVYLMYADDGKDPQSIDQGRFETLMFVQKKNEKGRLEMMFSKIKDYAGAPLKRTVHLEIVGLSKNKPLRFALNGQVMKKKKPDGKDQGYFYDEKKKVWSIDFVWDVPDVFVTEVE